MGRRRRGFATWMSLRPWRAVGNLRQGTLVLVDSSAGTIGVQISANFSPESVICCSAAIPRGRVFLGQKHR